MSSAEARNAAKVASERPLRVCFFFNAQRHQLLHGISTAVELARRPGFDVHVLSPSPDHIAYARRIADRLGGAPIRFAAIAPKLLATIRRTTGKAVPPKLLSLGMVAHQLNRFDAIALPERTSTILKSFGARRPRYLHLDHGAGDRAAGFDPRIARFDMVLMAGDKHRDRLSRDGLIRDGAHAVVGYPKFEAADAIRDPDWNPFRNGRPTVLYNPHFSSLGSWEKFGLPLLRAFAEQDRYNLIVAPHVRMFDGKKKRARWAATIGEFAGHAHILIDPGSDRSIDMTYTSLADIYVGDVSSQVYEFLRTPKPCLFLDALSIAWERDENYAHWHFGPVLRSTDGLIEALDAARASHPRFVEAQRQGFEQTFATDEVPASARAADAIADYLIRARYRARVRRPARVPSVRRRFQHAAPLALALGIGWLAHDAAGPLTGRATAASFVDAAVTSHQIARLRAAMRSQHEAAEYDRAEIRAATGITMPRLPASWHLSDVQIYPSDAGPIVQVAARTAEGEEISFVAMRIDTPAGRTPLLSSRKGDEVAYWEEGGQAYGIVGAISAERLLLLASDIARTA